MTAYALRALAAKAGFALAKRASRNQTLLDRLARRLLGRVLRFDFDLDEMVLMDQGYDPDELERYQKGL
ncbi:hypothetical protein L2U69_00460 [Zavarzinia compransoris]|uniref:hypothetical protein n=1 Tax=Zavarzinia marina TaxID=2911065 RepID=UPI001F21F5CB|nr:hypothetical protein [Zavarzinia marina]MCF4164114.1 hypothetical protein [Zavarzinia marina]